MFLRGQRVRIIKSNAKGRTHPQVGDVGYLNNLFLFPADKFIIADIFMCQYGNETKRRIECKKFVLDVGMKPAVRREISRTGVNKQFFLEKDYVCLNPTFCKKVTARDPRYGKFRSLLQFPQLVSTHGLWTSYTKRTNHRDRNKDSTFTVPCGSIASDAMITNRKLHTRSMSPIEIAAWLNAHGPILSAVLQLFHDYYERGDRSYRKRSSNCWEIIGRVMDIEQLLDKVTRFKTVLPNITAASPSTLENIVASMNLVKSLGYIALHRAESSFLNKAYPGDLELIKNTISHGELHNLLNVRKVYNLELESIPTALLVGSAIYRMFFADPNIEMTAEWLKDYLAHTYDMKNLSKNIAEIQQAAQSDSAALNRVFDVIDSSNINKSFSGFGYLSFKTGGGGGVRDGELKSFGMSARSEEAPHKIRYQKTKYRSPYENEPEQPKRAYTYKTGVTGRLERVKKSRSFYEELVMTSPAPTSPKKIKKSRKKDNIREVVELARKAGVEIENVELLAGIDDDDSPDGIDY